MELNIHIEDPASIVAGEHSILLRVKSEMSWEIWPIGYELGPDVEQVLIRASKEEEGQIEFAVVDGELGSFKETKVFQPILPVFFLVDGEMQIRCDSEMDVVAQCFDQDGQPIEGFVKSRSKSFMSSMSEPRMIDFPSGRLLLRITVDKPSQLCLDLFGEDDDPHASICIAHEEDGEKAWANVYKDIMAKGLWSPDKRRKMGYFDYKAGEAYELMILTKDQKVFLTFSSINGPVAMRENGELEENEVLRVRVRETPSAAGMPGVYDIEEVS